MLVRVRLNAHILVIALTLLLAICAVIASRWMNQAKANQATFSSVNAASFLGPLAPGAIAAGFGVGLATQTATAQTLPLPTQLGGSNVRIIDSSNASFQAQLFFVTAGQINYLIPDQIALGPAQLIVTNANGGVSNGTLQIENSSPAIFTAKANGQGIAAAVTTFDGVNFSATANPDGTGVPVNSGSAAQPNNLILFGTGFKRGGNVRLRIGGIDVTPSFSGAQGGLAGLDQLNAVIPTTMPSGMVDVMITADGRTSNIAQLLIQLTPPPLFMPLCSLQAADVQRIIAQAVVRAQEMGVSATIAVTDREANVLGVYKMNGARDFATIGMFNLAETPPRKLRGPDPDGLQDVNVRTELAAISKAGTASYFSTGIGNGQRGQSAISSRTASFIVQDHFPPRALRQEGGPLFGVQFSQFPCSDVRVPSLPLGLSGDPGGLALYKGLCAAGAIGVEVDGFYSVDIDVTDPDVNNIEESIAMAGTLGFEPPAGTTIDNVTIDGKQLPYATVPQRGKPNPPPLASLPGSVSAIFPLRDSPPSQFTPLTLSNGQQGRVIFNKFFPFKDSPSTAAQKLTAADVTRIINQAAQGAFNLRAGIRIPLNGPTEVNITVVDLNGNILGIFSTFDAPQFGFDVSAMKARTAAFFSNPNAEANLRAAGFGKFVDAAAADGIRFNGGIAWSSRGIGFLARPTFPDGIDNNPNGPFSKPIGIWSPFNIGLQLAPNLPFLGALVAASNANPNLDVRAVLSGQTMQPPCTMLPGVQSGFMMFAGGASLYKNGAIVGAIGISGDGIDQDDFISQAGALGFDPPESIRCNSLFVRGVRLPYVKLPSFPNQ